MISHQGERGLLNRLSVLVFPLVLVFLLAACGGGGGLTADAGTSLNDVTNVSLPSGTADGELLPLGSPMPALPVESGPAPASDARSTSAVLEYDGSDFLVASGGTVEGSSLLLQSSSSEAAWAVYKAGGLGGQQAQTFALETRPQGIDVTYYVAVGSFTDNRWHWLVETQLPEVNIDLSNDNDWISELGNLYWAVLIDGGNDIYVDKATIITGSGGGGGGGGGGNGGECIEEGPIQSIDDLAVIVNNHYFIHTLDTQWMGMQGQPLDREFFQPGMLVRVEGFEAEAPVVGGGCIAISVQLLDLGGGGGGRSFVIEGPVADVTPEYFTVDEVSGFAPQFVFHDEMTMFFHADGRPATWEDLQIGDFVYAEGLILDDGSWLAALVVIQDGNGGGGEFFQFAGEIQFIDQSSFSVGNQTFMHTADTLWFGENGEPLLWGNFSVGDMVFGDARADATGIFALTVIRESSGGGGGGGQGFGLAGWIHDIDAQNLWMVFDPTGDEKHLFHNEKTTFFLTDGSIGSWQDLEPGDFIEVQGVIEPDGSWVALFVFQDGNSGSGIVIIDGQLQSIDEGQMEIFEFATCSIRIVKHGPQTKFLTPEGNLIEWTEVPVGSKLLVEAEELDDDSLSALTVFLLDGPPLF